MIRWKRIPKELMDKVSSNEVRIAPNFTQDKRSKRFEGKVRAPKESFIVILQEKDGKYQGTPEKFT